MPKILLSFFVATLLFLNSTFGQTAGLQRIIIKIKKEIPYKIDRERNVIISSNAALVNALNALHIEKITSAVKDGTERNAVFKSLDLVRHIHYLDIPAQLSSDSVIHALLATGLFAYVEADQKAKCAGVQAVSPNDQYYSRQWGLKNNGTFNTSAIANADVDMEDAWTITTGSNSTVICILDTGLKMDHPEFAGRLWVNAGEIPNNGIDDDNDGYIDDVNGWDFVNSDNNPTDDHGHGTNVAGITSASANNGVGYAGVNWNARVMIGKVLGSNGSGSYSGMIDGIIYAVTHGANIINMSIGGTSSNTSLRDACDFADSNNVVLFACMMNENNNVTYYPAGFESTIAVGATDVNDYRVSPFFWSSTSGSNYGSHIEVVAPGNYIYGLSYSSATNYSTYWGGTSQATPLVAGIGSLMHAIKPDITFQQMKDILQNTAVDMVGRPTEDVPGWDQYMGSGRVNAFHALQSTYNLLPLALTSLKGKLVEKSALLEWTALNEKSGEQYIIEHGRTPTEWKEIGRVYAKQSLSGRNSYSFKDQKVETGVNFYRVREIDKTGKESLTNIVKLNLQSDSFTAKAYSPFNENLRLQIDCTDDCDINATIMSETGVVVQSVKRQGTKGVNMIQVDAKQFAKGSYVVTVSTSKGEKVSLKAMKQ